MLLFCTFTVNYDSNNLHQLIIAERPVQVEISEGQQQCVVCQDLANGIHFGAVSCEGCKVCRIYYTFSIYSHIQEYVTFVKCSVYTFKLVKETSFETIQMIVL